MEAMADDTRPTSLRERKKQETRFAIFSAAMDLFLAKGFDNVSVAQVAASANVSSVTVFNYFPAKEDLIMRPMAEGMKDPGEALQDRAPGEPVLAALRRGFLADLAGREPQTGLNTDGLAFMRVIRDSSDLMARVMLLERRRENMLAAAIAEETGGAPSDVTPRVVAAAVMGVIGAVVAENWGRLMAGESPDAIAPDAVAHAEQAFAMLEVGLRDYGVAAGR
jgi:AcrR family transcriptional regulator